MVFPMQFPLALLPLLFLGLRPVEADGQTQIFIDQIPLYTSLRPCAQDRISAIVRGQASGCGDNLQLTSFACFCIESSSEYVSIISTAVMTECAGDFAQATRTASGSVGRTTNIIGNVAGRMWVSTTVVTAAPTPTGAVAQDAMSALEAFESYCAKSTELTKFQPLSTVTITQVPQTVYRGQNSSGNSALSGTLIAAIVVSSILILIAVVAGLLFFLHRRHKQSKPQIHSSEVSNHVEMNEKESNDRLELVGDQQLRVEIGQNSKRVTNVYGVYNPLVELEAGQMTTPQRHEESNANQSWL